MISLSAGTRIWIAAGVTDMRCGFQGLAAKVQTALEENPLGGNVYIYLFRGRRGDLIKILWAAGRGVADVQRAQAKGANASASIATTREAASRHALPAHLSRENHVLEPESSCPDCGQTMQLLGEDISEQLAQVVAAFKVIRTIRRKLVCPCCSAIKQQLPMPGLPIERSIAHLSLLADTLVSKYADHQPLYRQSASAARDGVTLDRATSRAAGSASAKRCAHH